MTHVYGYRLFCVRVDCNCKRAMASGITRCAIASVLDDMKPKYRSSRIEKAQELGKTIMEQAGETEMTAFEDFSTELLELLRGLLQSSTTYRSSAAKREKNCGHLSIRHACYNSLNYGRSFSPLYQSCTVMIYSSSQSA